ncbi:hypothetical protein [Thermoactinospora rubra]|uniref:hypothetical protein n=1 Tax=Thermoactinospora rubra TaxID=1088767 RepID=UPI000A11C653|nr:hypothetical protein [Thermoactinospora rubra]
MMMTTTIGRQDHREARRRWRRLDRRTRRRLLVAGLRLRGHPDPGIAAVAARYAGSVLDRAWIPVSWLVVAPVPIVVLAAVMPLPSLDFDALGALEIAAWLTFALLLLIAVLASLVMLVALVAKGVMYLPRMLVLGRMELANALVALGPAGVGSLAPGRTVTVRYRGRGLAIHLAAATASAAGAALVWTAAGRVGGGPVLVTLLKLVSCALALGAVNALVTITPRSREPVLVLDEDGMRVLGGVQLAWPEVAELRLVPCRALTLLSVVRRPVPAWYLVVVPRDPHALLSRLGPSWRARAARAQRAFGAPIVVADLALDHSLWNVASCAPAPVRRFER